jgi:peptidoglycan/xylan/chitin deacetylase (PgdA/CDA1 family)
MSATAISEGSAERQRFASLLDQAAAQGRKLVFWWRDDDTEDATPALNRLLELARKHALPLALAVVPKRVTEALAVRLADEPKVAVLQHGWRHRNYASDGEKKMELGDHRPEDVVIDELARGFDRLRTRLPDKFLPVLVPPWNRIADSIRQQRRLAGLIGLSTIGPADSGGRHVVNVHVDIMAWRPPRPLGRAELYALLCGEIERRLAGDAEPVGIMTHHLVQEEATWNVLDEMLGQIAQHRAASWPPIADLFGLRPMSAG